MLGTPRQCPGPLSQDSPPAGSSRMDFTAVETQTGNVFFFCGLNTLICLFPYSICYAVTLKSVGGWILLVLCSRAFKGTLTKHPRYTMIFSLWILSLISKDKSPSLKHSFGFECSDFASCRWILATLAMRQARGWESLTREFGSHTGSQDPRILNLWAMNIQGVDEVEIRESHTLGWEKNDLFIFADLWELVSIPLHYKCRKQTMIVLVIRMTLSTVKRMGIFMSFHCCFRYL